MVGKIQTMCSVEYDGPCLNKSRKICLLEMDHVLLFDRHWMMPDKKPLQADAEGWIELGCYAKKYHTQF